MVSSPRGENISRKTSPKLSRAPYEQRIAGFLVLLILPGFVLSAVLVWRQPWAREIKAALLIAEILLCWLVAAALREHIVRPLQTLANIIGALRERDYSFRARVAIPDDALGELSMEVNMLADLLAEHRTGAIEATALLQRIVEEIDIPLFAFDPSEKLQLVNSAGERLLQQSSANVLGKAAADLGLKACLTTENETLVPLHFSTDARWFVRRSTFRQRGVPHTLVVLSDVSRALREEERRAWQRLIRVMGHELNNSLTPIKSIAGSLSARLPATTLTQQEKQDFERGLGIIETRAASLNRFLQAYRQLAQTPPPNLKRCSLSQIVARVVGLETRIQVRVVGGPEISLMADADQLDQMLINLIRNAAEAVLQSAEQNSAELPFTPQVGVSWKESDREAILSIEDNGPGLLNPANAFVPFYTTKPSGSGIGLVLSRQIAEAHGGSIELSNREGHSGCRVRVTLPLIR